MTDSDNDPGPQPSRIDKRWYFALMATCIGLFVLSWALIEGPALSLKRFMTYQTNHATPYGEVFEGRAVNR